jgi:hypothetical protein
LVSAFRRVVDERDVIVAADCSLESVHVRRRIVGLPESWFGERLARWVSPRKTELRVFGDVSLLPVGLRELVLMANRCASTFETWASTSGLPLSLRWLSRSSVDFHMVSGDQALPVTVRLAYLELRLASVLVAALELAVGGLLPRTVASPVVGALERSAPGWLGLLAGLPGVSGLDEVVALDLEEEQRVWEGYLRDVPTWGSGL